MTIFKVKIKWGKEIFPDVEIDTNESLEVLKAQIFTLTGIQLHRQKIMVKGSTIKDDNWAEIKLRNGALVLVMGSKDEDLPVEPTSKPTFIEDLTEEELNVAMDLPVGIRNLGNTCYLNAVVQCLKCVPELHESIMNFQMKSSSSGVSGPILTAAIQDVYKFMDSGKTAFPLVFVDLFRTTFPRFAEREGEGKYVQQDASECWTEMVRLFQEVLPAKDTQNVDKKFSKSLVDQYFSGEFVCKWNCDESSEKAETKEIFQQLSCHINQEIRYLQNGLSAKMEEQISKKSEKLDKDALFTKKSFISRLPSYLSIEMVRFYYKEKENVNAKILKDVKFPITLDIFTLCSADLQAKLSSTRAKYQKMDEYLLEEYKAKKNGDKSPHLKYTTLPTSFSNDMGSNNSGFYQLQAVLTHQGRTSSSGHYVAWVRFREKEWLKCDDDIITPVTEDEILKLSGGGDWHTAYILLYGPRELRNYDANTDSDTSKLDTEKTDDENMET